MKITARAFSLAISFAASLCLAAEPFTPVPLDSLANRDLTDNTTGGTGKGGWTDQGKENCLDAFPRGKIELKGVPFQIPEKGNAAIMFSGKKLSSLPGLVKEAAIKVPAGANGSSFYLLACYVWGASDGADAADISVKFADGSVEEQRMVIGKHVSGWWGPKDLPKGVVAWKGRNGQNAEVGVYLIPYSPKGSGSSAVSEIKIVANGGNEGSLAVIGLTVGERKANDVLPPPMVWKPWDGNSTDGWFTIQSKYDDAEQAAPWEEAFDFFKRPAGSLGWTVAKGENLEFEKAPGTPVKFKGVCATGNGFYPYVAEAEKCAKILRKFGFNQVRFHSLLDTLLVEKGGYIVPELNKARMEKFDKYFAALKGQGVYVKISGCFSGRWAKETGVEAFDKIESLNNTQYTFDERHQELYLKSLGLFLEHVNPHTKLRYADDPAFNMYKVVNESSLFFNHATGLPGPYAIKFQDKYNQWLKDKYGDNIKLAEAWRVAGETSPLNQVESLEKGTVAVLSNFDLSSCKASNRKRAIDQTLFYYETERAWFDKVYKFIRATGSKVMVQGSSWGGPGHLQELQTAISSNFDFVGKHTYWLHPHGGWSPEAALFPNEPVTRHPADSFLQCVFQHVAGKPFAITEWNFCFPNDYTLDAAPVMAAYGALQNVVSNHRFNMDLPEAGTSKRNFFGIFDSASGVATEPLSYFMYVRGDVKAAPVIYRNALSKDSLFNPDRKKNIKRTDSGSRFFMSFDPQEIPNEAILAGGVRLSLDEKSFPSLWDEAAYRKCVDEKSGAISSMTGELVWNYNDGNILVKTPLTRALIGFTGGREYQNGPLSMKLSEAYSVVGFSSLDMKPLEESSKMLVTLAARDRNSGQSLEVLTQGGKRVESYASFRMGKVGSAPLLFEPVEVVFSLKTPADGKWAAIPLDLAGRPMNEKKIALTAEGGLLKGRLSNKESGALNFILASDR